MTIRLLTRTSLAFALVFGFAGSSFATHTTVGTANYLGELHDGASFDEITLINNVDWYILPVTGGQSVTISVLRGDVGSLLPNVSIFDGLASSGQSPSAAGLTELFFPPLTGDNGSSPTVSGSFVPTADATWSLLVTTWFGETGTYDITCEGCAAEEMSAVVPLPAGFPLLGTAIAGLGLLGRWRRSRQSQAA